jgi:hypothetical protein
MLDLQEDRQLARMPTSVRTSEAREHGPLLGIEVDDALEMSEQIDL